VYGGWDCHGLPIENLIEKELGLKSKKEIEEYGVEKFYESCANSVLRYENAWKQIIPQIGRWIDMDNAYKTMDATYTESVWWSFAELYKKGLAYEGFKVMHVCPRCETPLAQSEVSLAYKDVTDISVTVEFELEDKTYNGKPIYMLAWTTTPWTLPGNTALAVNKGIQYVLVESSFEGSSSYFIVAKSKVEHVFAKSEFKILEEINIEDYIGERYKPVFDVFDDKTYLESLENSKNIWKVWHADFITDDTGTGIAHEAPAFGVEDMELAQLNKIPVIKHVLMNGYFSEQVTNSLKELQGIVVKKQGDTMTADIQIIKYLAQRDNLFDKQKIVHSYPHCWRCDTPLLNYGTTSWFVAVTKIREKLLAENSQIGWVPANVRDGRFGKWLEGARDWAVSRNRYWGAPVPVWKSITTGEVFVPGSLKELLARTKSKNSYTLLRHGQTHSNLKHSVQLDPNDVSDVLTSEGVEQAQRAVKHMQSDNKKIDMIITSPFVRTKETAKILAEGLGLSEDEIIVDERLGEFNPGCEFAGKNWSEVVKAYEDKAAHHFTGKVSEDGESYKELMLRGVKVLQDLEEKYEGKNILIVSHRSLIRWMIFFAEGNLSMSPNLKEADLPDVGNVQPLKVDFKPIPHDETGAVNFHVPFIDDVVVYDREGNIMKREPLVFDCWYESGSMPYGQVHYPFENKQLFEENFPAQFIGEAQDQTRGWFYTMLILSTALFDKTSFQNVICTGLIMAEDGKKMSKSLRNYTDPMELIEKYGSDSMRYYLLSSPVIRGENVNFSDKGLGDVYRKNIARLVNVVSMYQLYADDTNEPSQTSAHVLDKYILARLKQLKKEVTDGFESYELDKAFRPVEKFVDDLSVWYVRRSRERIKSDNKNVRDEVLGTLQHVLLELSVIMSPIMPFVAESIFQVIKPKVEMTESVHLLDWGMVADLLVEESEVLEETEKARNIISRILEERTNAGIKVRQPLASATISNSLSILPENSKEFEVEILDETNLKALQFGDLEDDKLVTLDTNITEELKQEGAYRELARAIQDARKEKKLQPQDEVELNISTNSEFVKEVLNKFAGELKTQCNLSTFSQAEVVNGQEVNVAGEKVVFELV
jgi:isoleucyl-tRNA synthetase